MGASRSARVDLYGTGFTLDDVDITSSLSLNSPFIVQDRDVSLRGVLSDGSPFSFDLNDDYANLGDFFDKDAHLTITFVLPGDIPPWAVTSSDYDTWKANFGMTAGSSPLLPVTRSGNVGAIKVGSRAKKTQPRGHGEYLGTNTSV